MGKIVFPTHEQHTQLDRSLVELKAGLDFDGAQRLIENGDIIQALAAGQIDVASIRDGFTYPFSVDYSMSVAALLEAGCYDWVNEDVTDAHFPITGSGIVEQHGILVCLGRNASDEEVTAEFRRRQLRDATNQELLAFGMKFPNVQRKFPVIQRGSVWTLPIGRRCVSYLGEFAGRRHVRLHYLDRDWHELCRFLAVPQVP